MRIKGLYHHTHQLQMWLILTLHRFLIECATWIGEGRHLDLLEMILDNGFDPSNIASPLFQKWPQLSSPDWIAENITPDPFFIEYLAIIADISPGEFGYISDHWQLLTKARVCGCHGTSWCGYTPVRWDCQSTQRLFKQARGRSKLLRSNTIAPCECEYGDHSHTFRRGAWHGHSW